MKGRIIELLLIYPQSENMEVSHSSEFVVFLTIKKLLSVRHLPYSYKIFLYSLKTFFLIRFEKFDSINVFKNFLGPKNGGHDAYSDRMIDILKHVIVK